MFIGALPMMVKYWEQPKCLAIGHWVNRLCMAILRDDVPL